MFEELLNSPLSFTLDQLLSLVPMFRDRVYSAVKKSSMSGIKPMMEQSVGSNLISPEDVDFTVPTVQLDFDNRKFASVFLDGGSGVNILAESEFLKMKNVKLEPAPFQVRMADHSRVQPIGMLRKQIITIQGLQFSVNFVVLRMKENASAYSMLLGRPWFRTAKLKQDWEKNVVTLKKGKKVVSTSMGVKQELSRAVKPMMAQPISFADKVEDDEEDSFLDANPTVVPVFEVDVERILDRYVIGPEAYCAAVETEEEKVSTEKLEELEGSDKVDGDEDKVDVPPKEAITRAEFLYDKLMEKVSRVREDDLQDLNLGSVENPKVVKISVNLDDEFKGSLKVLLQEFMDVFAWDYSNLKGMDPQVYKHKINLKEDAVPVIQQRYRMNPNYAKQVKEELDKLLSVGFIVPVDRAEWLSPKVVVPKKSGKIRVCVDYRKLNAATISDPFPLRFIDLVLDDVSGHEMYSFLDGFSSYNQIPMAEEDVEKTAFNTEWGAFAYTVMSFGLKNGPPSFSKAAFKTFKPYLTKFMRIFMDDFLVFGEKVKHLEYLRKCFKRCRLFRMSLNPHKCAIAVQKGKLLGHIISKDGMSIDSDKISAIQKAAAPNNLKAIMRFLG